MHQDNNKTLLILGASAIETEVVKRAQQLGYYVIVTDNHPNPEVNSPAKFVADLAWDISWTDFDALETACRAASVAGVLSGFSEIRVEAQIKLCQRLGLPCDTTLNQLEITRDKVKFKNLCRKCGIPVVEEFNEQDAINHLPVIIKPTDRGGSAGIKVVTRREDFSEALEHSRAASLTNNVVIEKYIADQTKVDAYYLVEDGIPYLMALSSALMCPAVEGHEICQRAWYFPSRHTGNWMRNIHPHMPDMIEALKLKNGYLTMSAFADDDGNFKCFETGLRLSAELSFKFTDAAYGYNYLDFLIAGAMSERKPQRCDFTRQTDVKMLIYNFFATNGIIKHKQIPSGDYVDIIAATPEIDSHESRYPYVGMYFSMSTDCDELIENALKADKELVLTDHQGRDMIIFRANRNSMVESLIQHVQEQ